MNSIFDPPVPKNLEQYRSKRLNAFRQAKGDRSQIGPAMMSISKEQNQKMRELLNDEQYKV